MELIKIETKENISGVSAKELFKELGMNTSQWVRYYENNITKNNFFIENIDYCTFDTMSRGNASKDFVINIEMAKHLCMLAKTEKAHEIRNYFIKCEQQLKHPKQELTFEEQTLMVLTGLTKKVEEQKLQIETQENRINKLIHSKKTYTSSEIGYELGMTANKLNKILVENKIIRKVNKTYVGYSHYSDKGYFDIKQTELENGKIIYNLRFTDKGRLFILDKLGD